MHLNLKKIMHYLNVTLFSLSVSPMTEFCRMNLDTFRKIKLWLDWTDILQLYFIFHIIWEYTKQPSLSQIKLTDQFEPRTHTLMYSHTERASTTYAYILYVTKNNNIHIHEVSVVLHTLGTKGLIHTNGIFPTSNMCPAPRSCFSRIFSLRCALTGLFQGHLRSDATCSLVQPSSRETTPTVQATLLNQDSHQWTPLSSPSGSHDEEKIDIYVYRFYVLRYSEN